MRIMRPMVLYLDVCSEGKSKMSASTGLANRNTITPNQITPAARRPARRVPSADGVHGPFFVPTIQA